MEFRTLKEQELPAWFEHCAEVFQAPKEYFAGHWRYDPDRALSGVFIAYDAAHAAIAATARVFHRQVVIRGHAMRMAGIGEVSTKVQYRRQGLATRLLQMANDYADASGFDISFLFTSPLNMRLYAAAGFQAAPLLYTAAHDVIPAGEAPAGCSVRQVDAAALPAKQRAEVMALHEAYSRHFDGMVLRSPAYWADWVFSNGFEPGHLFLVSKPDTEELLGYFSLKETEGYQVQEVAVAKGEWERDRGRAIVERALPVALGLLGCTEPTDLRIPRPLGACFARCEPWDDTALMARLTPHGLRGPLGECLDTFMKDSSTRVFWATDNF